MKRLTIVLCLCSVLVGCGAVPSQTPTNAPASLPPSSVSNISQEENTSASSGSTPVSIPSASVAEPSQEIPSAVASKPAVSSNKKPTDITTLTPSAPSSPTAPETLHITKGGDYSLTGNKQDVMITVDAKDQIVNLTLAGVTVANTKGPALYVASAKQVNLILAKGTQNILSDGTSYTLSDGTSHLDAALFSRSDLHLSGEGSLTVQGNCKHGIVSKDDLVITSGRYHIQSKNVALEGKDCVTIGGGTFTLKAGTDGIRATNTENPNKGEVSVQGGTLTVTAGNDGVQAATNITVAGGEMTLTAGQSGFQAQGAYRQTGGKVTLFGTVGSGKALLNAKTAASIEGGTFLGFGDHTKAKHFTNAKGGCALLLPFANQSANTPFLLTKGGNQVVKATPTVAYSLALVYTPALTTGEYTLTLGNKTAGFTVNTNLFTLQ